MSKESIVVRNFLITEEVGPILELLSRFKGLVWYQDDVKGTKYFKRSDYMDFCLVVIDLIKEGKFKPNVKA